MPKGSNPNSRKNLTLYPVGSEEARKQGRKGGLQNAKNQQVFKSVKDVLKKLSEETHTNAKGQTAQGFEIIGRKLFSMAQQGNMKAMDMYLRLSGELTNTLDVTTNGKDIVNEPLVVEIIDKREQIEKDVEE